MHVGECGPQNLGFQHIENAGGQHTQEKQENENQELQWTPARGLLWDQPQDVAPGPMVTVVFLPNR